MQGHLPVPPQPHIPDGIAPLLGYMSMRQRQPLEELSPVEREWWELDEDEEWPAQKPRAIKVTAVVVSICLAAAGVGTFLGAVLTGH
jgi:hypothetical protein